MDAIKTKARPPTDLVQGAPPGLKYNRMAGLLTCGSSLA
ncbi:hypothetical protein TRICHSKD4_4853 [Roseibium sp. TrichSKD4]|nr:hypothetical protein TRICHSKD4_4853 [Roseibium sp. TrichSKD4]